MRLRTDGRRRAILLEDGTALAVPPFPPSTPHAVRVKVYEYVLRRQPGLAEITAQIAADAASGGDARDRLASIMGEDPSRSSVMGVAA